MFEVLSALVTYFGHTWEDVLEVAALKRTDRGGVDARMWLDSW